MIDIGSPKHAVDEKVYHIVRNSLGLFGLFLLIASIAISLLVSRVFGKPVARLMTVMQEVVFALALSQSRDQIDIYNFSFGHSNAIDVYFTSSHKPWGDLEVT